MHYNYIREAVKYGEIILKYIPTAEMIADIMTKSLDRDKHNKFCIHLGLSPKSGLKGSVEVVIPYQGDAYQKASANLTREKPNPIRGIVLLSYTNDEPHEPTLSDKEEDKVKKTERIFSPHREMYSKLNLLQIKKEFK